MNMNAIDDIGNKIMNIDITKDLLSIEKIRDIMVGFILDYNEIEPDNEIRILVNEIKRIIENKNDIYREKQKKEAEDLKVIVETTSM